MLWLRLPPPSPLFWLLCHQATENWTILQKTKKNNKKPPADAGRDNLSAFHSLSLHRLSSGRGKGQTTSAAMAGDYLRTQSWDLRQDMGALLLGSVWSLHPVDAPSLRPITGLSSPGSWQVGRSVRFEGCMRGGIQEVLSALPHPLLPSGERPLHWPILPFETRSVDSFLAKCCPDYVPSHQNYVFLWEVVALDQGCT